MVVNTSNLGKSSYNPRSDLSPSGFISAADRAQSTARKTRAQSDSSRFKDYVTSSTSKKEESSPSSARALNKRQEAREQEAREQEAKSQEASAQESKREAKKSEVKAREAKHQEGQDQEARSNREATTNKQEATREASELEQKQQKTPSPFNEARMSADQPIKTAEAEIKLAEGDIVSNLVSPSEQEEKENEKAPESADLTSLQDLYALPIRSPSFPILASQEMNMKGQAQASSPSQEGETQTSSPRFMNLPEGLLKASMQQAEEKNTLSSLGSNLADQDAKSASQTGNLSASAPAFLQAISGEAEENSTQLVSLLLNMGKRAGSLPASEQQTSTLKTLGEPLPNLALQPPLSQNFDAKKASALLASIDQVQSAFGAQNNNATALQSRAFSMALPSEFNALEGERNLFALPEGNNNLSLDFSPPQIAAPALLATHGAAAAHSLGASAETTRPVPLHLVPLEIGMQASKGHSEFQLRLDPAELGRVDVRISISNQGDVQASLIVDRVETLAMLKRDSSNLELAFQQAGLTTNPDALSFSLRGEGQQHRHDPNQTQAGKSGSPSSDENGLEPPLQPEITLRRAYINYSQLDLSV